jgi:hypothetical protein
VSAPSVLNENARDEIPVNGQADEVAQVRRTGVDGCSGVVRTLGRCF